MTRTAAKPATWDGIGAVRRAQHMHVCHKEGEKGQRINEDRQGLIGVRVRGRDDPETLVSGFVGDPRERPAHPPRVRRI
jgi:hypothetical protein